MLWAVAASSVIALGLSSALAPAARWLGRRAGGVVCRPAGPPTVGRTVPRSGSLALVASVVVATAIGWLALHQPAAPYREIVWVSSLILLGGLVDDWVHELGIVVKMLIQIAAACFLIGHGIQTQIAFLPLWANLLLTILWVVGVTNACNLLDILDGLVLGVAVIIAATFAWIAASGQAFAAAILCAAIAGGAAGVWRLNRHPASIFLGDAGAQWLGFLFAATAISLRYAPPERSIALLTPLLVLAVPLFDTAFVILMRHRRGRSVLAKSADHYVLRWIARGHTHPQAVHRVWALGAACSAAALAVYYASNVIGTITILAVVCVLARAWHTASALPDRRTPASQDDRPSGNAVSPTEPARVEMSAS